MNKACLAGSALALCLIAQIVRADDLLPPPPLLDASSTPPAASSTPPLDLSDASTTPAAATTTPDVASSTPDAAGTDPATSTATTTPSDSTDASTTSSTSTATTTAVVALPDPVSILLDIESPTTTLFKKSLLVQPCPLSPASPTSTVSGMCALEQAHLEDAWSWWGDDAFLNSIAGVANDYVNNQYWTWFANLAMGQTALNKHALSSGETLLLTIGRMPLKLLIASSSPMVGATTTVSATQFGFDESYNAVWLPAASSTIHIGPGAFAVDASGTVSFTASSTTTLDVYATEDGFLPSDHFTLTPIAPPTAHEDPPPASSETTGTNGPIPSAGNGGGGAPQIQNPAPQPLAFLLGKQRKDGGFGNAMLSDWAAVALARSGAPESALDSLKKYLAADTTLWSVTDYERRAMALEALGVDPYSSGIIRHIIASFDGIQTGDSTLVNDDIFALIALSHAGYSFDDSLIQHEIQFVLSRQGSDGSWENVDLTSAAIQALAPFSSDAHVESALAKARSYLASKEDQNGCFGNSFSTSWALQAILSLEENPAQWQKGNNATPATCLAAMQQQDGGFEPLASDDETRVWATAYAIPALEGKSWNAILHSFPKGVDPARQAEGSDAAGSPPVSASTTPSQMSDVNPIATTTAPTPANLPPPKQALVSTTTQPSHAAPTSKKPAPALKRDKTFPSAILRIAPAQGQSQTAAANLPASSAANALAHLIVSLWQRIMSII